MILCLSETVVVFPGREEEERVEVLPIAVMLDPVTSIDPSRMTSREGLIVMTVACVYRVDFARVILTV